MTPEYAAAHSRLWHYRVLIENTKAFIQQCLTKVGCPYVACSFGKDSAAMLHLIRAFAPNIPVVFVYYPETEIIDNYAETIEKWGALNLIQHLHQCNIGDDINEKDLIPLLAKQYGFDAGFVGIRKDESKGRRYTLKKYGKLHTFDSGLTRVCPMATWTANDVMAYCITNDIPMLSAYAQGGSHERTSVGLSPDLYGFRERQIRNLKYRDITRYNLLIESYPELKQYT